MNRAGLEPATNRLKVYYSTNWVIDSKSAFSKVQVPQQVVSALLLLRWFFIVTPQMTRLGVDMRKNVFFEVLSLRLFCLYPIT